MTNKSNYKSTILVTAVTEKTVLAYNKNRTTLILFNQGADDIQVYFETKNTMFFLVEAGKGVHFIGAAPQNEIRCKATANTPTLTILEA